MVQIIWGLRRTRGKDKKLLGSNDRMPIRGEFLHLIEAMFCLETFLMLFEQYILL